MRLGIDFGTCFSSAAYIEGGTHTLVKDPFFLDGSIPSSVFLTPQEKWLVGKAANNRRRSDPTRYRNELKRDLGKDVPFLPGNRPYRIEELIANVLSKIKQYADTEMTNAGRRSFTGAVLTIPAMYQKHKRALMLEAAAQAGFIKEEVALLEEPVAAAHFYAQQHNMSEGEILLVYDLGGGSFDTAFLRKKGDEFEYLAQPAGIERCGGIDFDRFIYNDIIQQNPQLQEVLQGTRDNKVSLMARTMIGDSCINLKHQLSFMEEAEISFVVPGTGDLIEYSLTQKSFNQMISSTIEETIRCCRDMIQSTKLPYEQISRILLVGGSCRIPFVRQGLQQEFQRPINAAYDLELAICLGAGLYAAQHEIFVVSATPGAADYTTIGEALQKASPKGLVVVWPGIYQESLVLDREITITGKGPRENIVITSPQAIALKMATTRALVRGITLSHTATAGPTWNEHGAVVVTQGELTLENCVINSVIHGVSVWGTKSSAILQRCQLLAKKNANVALNNGSRATLQNCEISGNADTGIHVRHKSSLAIIQQCQVHDGKSLGIFISAAGQASIDGCDIFGNGSSGIQIRDEGSSATIRQTRIYEGKGLGLSIWQKGHASLEDCDIFANLHAGILISDEGSTASIVGGQIHDGQYTGIDIAKQGRIFLEDCDIHHNAGAGIRVRDEGSQATLLKCHVHDGMYIGILIHKKSYGELQACKIFHNAGPGIRICNANSKATINGCHIHDDNAVGITIEDDGEAHIENCTIESNRVDLYIEPGSVVQTSENNKLPNASVSRNITVWRQALEPEHPKLFFSKPEDLALIHALTEHTGIVYGVAISPDGQTLVSGSADQTIKIWNMQTGQLLRTLSGHTTYVTGVAISPDGQALVSGSGDKTIKEWNVSTGKLIRTLSGHTGYVYGVAISPDGQTLVSGSYDQTIRAWNVHTGQLLHILSGHTRGVWDVAFSPDGQTLASGSEDKTIKVWNLQRGKLLRTLSGHKGGVRDVAFSPDGQTLASGSEDKTIKVWNLQMGQTLRTLSGHKGGVWDVAFSPDGQTLLSGSEDKTIKVWNLQTGKTLRTLSGHTSNVLSITISADGQTFVSGDGNGTINIWRQK